MRSTGGVREKFINNFPELNDHSLVDEILNIASFRKVKEGVGLIEYGDQITHVPLVLSGSLKVMRINEEDEEVLLYFLVGGDSCAASFSCCMVKKRSEITAIAEEDSELIMIPLNKADSWLEKFPVWRNFIFNMYDQRLFSLIDTVDRLAFSKLDEQLMDYLELKAQIKGSQSIEIKHAEIATDLNVSREAISRLLKKLEKSGKVELGRNRIALIEN